MPWENIGSVGDGQMPEDREWLLCCHDMALAYLKFTCGAPPAGSELGVMWNEHDIGEYPSIGVYSEFDPPWDYINQCEAALERFDEAVSWSDIEPSEDAEDDEDQSDDGVTIESSAPPKERFPEGTEFWLVGKKPSIPVAINGTSVTAFDTDPPRGTMSKRVAQDDGSQVTYEEWASNFWFRTREPPRESDFPAGSQFWLVGGSQSHPSIPVVISPDDWNTWAFDTNPPRDTMSARVARDDGSPVTFEKWVKSEYLTKGIRKAVRRKP